MTGLLVALAMGAFALGALAGAYAASAATDTRAKPRIVEQIRLDPLPEYLGYLELEA